MRTGLVGLGGMGRGIAATLLEKGHELDLWNRSRGSAEALRGERSTVAGSPAEACRSGAVISMLSDDRAIEAVALGPDGLRAGLPRGGVHVSMSTISPEAAERLAAAHAGAGQLFVSAPVFGRPDAAAAGQLFVVAAGPPAAIEKVRPLLEAAGQALYVLSGKPADANVVKLAGNFMITAAIEALAESLALVGKAGISPETFLRILTETLFAAPAYRTYGKVLIEGRFSPPGFRLPLGAKDNRLLLREGERHDVPLPLASLIHDRMIAALAKGYGELDWSSFGRIAAEEAGLAPSP